MTLTALKGTRPSPAPILYAGRDLRHDTKGPDRIFLRKLVGYVPETGSPPGLALEGPALHSNEPVMYGPVRRDL